MNKPGQKIELVDDVANDIMDKINDYFWINFGYDLENYYPNGAVSHGERDAETEIYSIIHNELKKILL